MLSSGECRRCKMPCESCAVQFSVFRRKRGCPECERWYCAACLRRGGGVCAPCRALSTRPLARHAIAHLKVRDLQCFLQRQNVSTRGCVEKEELVSLCVSHVNSAAYRRRGVGGAGGAGGAGAAGPFTALKGLTTNINDFLNSAFDIRPPNVVPARAPPPAPSTVPPMHHNASNCYNSAHAHAHAPADDAADAGAYPSCKRERFTTRPGGEPDIEVQPPAPAAAPAPEGASRSESTLSGEGAPLDTADCFEIEDLDDAGWEFVTRPADPLPNDSEVLLTESSPEPAAAGAGSRLLSPPGAGPGPGDALRAGGGGTPRRAASELELSRSESAHAQLAPDSSSLQDEPLMDEPQETHDGATDAEQRWQAQGPGQGPGEAVTLDALRSERELEALSVRQLKQLLWRNRVEWAGCVERAELLQRARLLWRDHAQAATTDIEKLPIEECCKICMAAPLQCVLLECGHVVACAACARQLAECPVCRQYVVRAVRLFRS